MATVRAPLPGGISRLAVFNGDPHNFEIVPTLGDGNCFFNAVSMALPNNTSAASLRRMATAVISKEEWEVKRRHESSGTYEDYVAMVSASGTWCEGEDIERLENAFNGDVKFLLISTSLVYANGMPRVYFTPFGETKAPHTFIMIAYDEGSHYSLMRYARRSTFNIQELPWSVSWLAACVRPPFRKMLLAASASNNGGPSASSGIASQ